MRDSNPRQIPVTKAKLVQSNVPETHNREFGTPAKAKSKLSTKQKQTAETKENHFGTMQDKGTHSKRSTVNGGVPTAHVFPNQVATSDSTFCATQWAEPTLATEHRRTPTSLGNRSDAVANGHESSYVSTTRDYDVSDSHDSMFRPSLSTITGRQSDIEFHTLIHDPEQTINETRFHADRDIFAAGDRENRLGDREVSDITRDGSSSGHLTSRSHNTTPALTEASMPVYSGPYGHPIHPGKGIPGFAAPSHPPYVYDRPPSHLSFQAASYSGGHFMGGSYPAMPPAPPPGPYGRGYDELAQWQMKHHEQLRRQQLEASQPLYGTSSAASVTSLLTNDPHKLDSVKRAADNIIREKDTIIDRQKLKILEMERQSTKSEAEIQAALLRRVHEEGDAMSMKLQEKQYETASLKAQMTELLSGKSKDLTEMEKKLAAREYELAELQKSIETQLQSKTREIEELQEKIKDKESLVLEWKDKHAAARDAKEEAERKNRQLERYMQDLPTLDEQAEKNSELRTLKEDKHRYKTKANKYEAKVKDLQKGIESRDSLIQSLEETQDDLKVRIETLQDENTKLTKEVKRLREGGATIPEEDLEELRHDNRRLQSDLEKARKLLEGKHKKMQQAEAHHQQDVAEWQDRLSQEENTVTGLREEIRSKDQHLSKLRENLKQLSAENQDLLDAKFVLQDKVKEYEKQHTGEVQKLEKRLMKELASTFRELQAMVQICVQCADGEDPNISSLLGIKASSHMAELDQDEPVGDNIQALKYKLSKVKQLQGEVDKLRELMSNKYAEEWGENLNCTTQ